MFIMTQSARSNRTHMSVVQHGQRTQRAKVVHVRNTPTPDAIVLHMSEDTYLRALEWRSRQADIW